LLSFICVDEDTENEKEDYIVQHEVNHFLLSRAGTVKLQHIFQELWLKKKNVIPREKKVLLIEDNIMVGALTSKILQNEGYCVRETFSIQQVRLSNFKHL
jgi:hypothetical protein